MIYVFVIFREDIVIWVQKKTGSPIITVNTVDEAQRFLNKYHTFVVGLFNKLEVTIDHYTVNMQACFGI